MIIEEGMDAVFLPGKIHGCEYQVYIILNLDIFFIFFSQLFSFNSLKYSL